MGNIMQSAEDRLQTAKALMEKKLLSPEKYAKLEDTIIAELMSGESAEPSPAKDIGVGKKRARALVVSDDEDEDKENGEAEQPGQPEKADIKQKKERKRGKDSEETEERRDTWGPELSKGFEEALTEEEKGGGHSRDHFFAQPSPTIAMWNDTGLSMRFNNLIQDLMNKYKDQQLKFPLKRKILKATLGARIRSMGERRGRKAQQVHSEVLAPEMEASITMGKEVRMAIFKIQQHTKKCELLKMLQMLQMLNLL